MIYRFKEGGHLKGDAQPVGERLDLLRRRRTGLTPESVLVDAKSEKSPLHGYFEWNDGIAAHRYRLDQAGHLIRCVTVVVDEPLNQQSELLDGARADRPITIRAFVPVQRAEGGRVYESTAVALSDADMRRQVLAQAYSELGAVARKYRELQELAEVVRAIDRVGQAISPDRLPARG